VSNVVWNKLTNEWSSVLISLFMAMTFFKVVHLVVLHFLDDLVQIVVEVVGLVSFQVVFGVRIVPVVANGFSSLVKLNELLEFEVGAAESISEPVDGLSFNYEAQNQRDVGDVKCSAAISEVLVESTDVEPE